MLWRTSTGARRSLAPDAQLTFGFRPPKDACDKYRILMAGLRELERDLHLHIHKENNILFPRAAAVEALQGPVTAHPFLSPQPTMT